MMTGNNRESKLAQREQEHVFANVFAYARTFAVSAIALNGAAAIVLMAVIGFTVSQTESASLLTIANIPKALNWFIYGVGYGGTIVGFAYFAHVFFVRAHWHEQGRSPATTKELIKWMNKNARNLGNACMGVSVLAGISSYVCFIRAGFLISDTVSLLYNT